MATIKVPITVVGFVGTAPGALLGDVQKATVEALAQRVGKPLYIAERPHPKAGMMREYDFAVELDITGLELAEDS